MTAFIFYTNLSRGARETHDKHNFLFLKSFSIFYKCRVDTNKKLIIVHLHKDDAGSPPSDPFVLKHKIRIQFVFLPLITPSKTRKYSMRGLKIFFSSLLSKKFHLYHFSSSSFILFIYFLIYIQVRKSTAEFKRTGCTRHFQCTFEYVRTKARHF